MQRFLPAAAILGVVALIVAGAVWLAIDDGPFAYKVHGHEVSQSSVDEELKALAENRQFAALIKQGGGQTWSNQSGSATAGFAARWLSLRIAQGLAPREVHQRDLSVSDADRRRAREIARRAVPGGKLESLPEWFQQREIRRWTSVAALERDLLANPSGELDDVIKADCPAGRYVAHIAVATAIEAAAIRQDLAAGQDFAQLARARSIDRGSAADGGSLGCLDDLQGRVDQAFLDVANNQPIGVPSDPVQTSFGYHVILVSDQPSGSHLQDLQVSAVLRSLTRGQRVEIDPRYGTWDRSTGQVLPPVPPRD